MLRLLEAQSIYKLRPSRRLIISGISGSGKTTLGRALEKKRFIKIPNIVTRRRRQGEREGENIFIDEKTFRHWRAEGRLAFYRKTNGVWHGILKEHLDMVKSSRQPVYFDKSIPSVKRLIEFLPNVKFSMIYLLPPSFGVLYARMVRREGKGGLKRGEIYKRFLEEINELEDSTKLPYAYLVNDKVERLVHLAVGDLSL